MEVVDFLFRQDTVVRKCGRQRVDDDPARFAIGDGDGLAEVVGTEFFLCLKPLGVMSEYCFPGKARRCYRRLKLVL